jgi:hypothetical protein
MCAATRREEGTTTPFYMVVLLDLCRFHPPRNVMAWHGDDMPAISG